MPWPGGSAVAGQHGAREVERAADQYARRRGLRCDQVLQRRIDVATAAAPQSRPTRGRRPQASGRVALLASPGIGTARSADGEAASGRRKSCGSLVVSMPKIR